MNTFPVSLDNLPTPLSTDTLKTYAGGVGHAELDAGQSNALNALEAKVGVNSSTVTTSLDYILNGHIASANISPTAGITGTQLASNAGITGSQIVSNPVFSGQPTIGGVQKLASGVQEKGGCGVQGVTIVVDQTYYQVVNLKTTLTNIPTSITFTVNESSLITATTFQYGTAFFIDNFIFQGNGSNSATGSGIYWFGEYLTVGN